MKPYLSVQNLTKTFEQKKSGTLTAVEGISFFLCRGETLGIVGESGSGKSTLARLITRRIDPTGGTILLDGTDITHLKGKALRPVYRSMQMVFQHPAASFDPRRTLGDGIGESLWLSGCSKAETQRRVKKLLTDCGLSETFARRYPHEVSGGECQRAAIARALAGDPAMLICDEATSALDATVQQQILSLLRRLQEERHLSYLFICHNLALVQSFCDRVLVMHDGRIVEEGTPDDILFHPTSDYTKELVEAAF